MLGTLLENKNWQNKCCCSPDAECWGWSTCCKKMEHLDSEHGGGGDGWKHWWEDSYVQHPMKSKDHLVKLLWGQVIWDFRWG